MNNRSEENDAVRRKCACRAGSLFQNVAVIVLCSTVSAWGDGAKFGRDIGPLLSDRCFECHGPDREHQLNELRLDTRGHALESAIVPGQPEKSELIARISSDDPSVKMPPPDSGRKPLSEAEIELFRQWIRDDAPYQEHWAYVSPRKAPLPNVADQAWERNEIDRFILAEIEAAGMTPSAVADRRTLVRRLSFDLLGLPPSPAAVQSFLADQKPRAYERLVDELLASEHYGERMAQQWLDLVRYADTIGYHSDNPREVDAYRDYVIDAFNHNKPFDDFTIEQLAGDLLPDPTLEQKIASGYNRMLQTTREGGAQPKEYIAIYQADRVRNVGSVWLATTMGCCQCHDHKFDPITTKEFYELAAFFADIKEVPVGFQPPNLSLATPDQTARIKLLDAQIQKLKTAPVDAELLQRWIADERARLNAETEKSDADGVAEAKTAKKGKPKKPTAEEKAEAELRKKLETALARPEEALQPSDHELFEKAYRALSDEHQMQREQLAKLEAELKSVHDQVRTTLISESIEPRTVRVLPRGNWLDESGEVVSPGIPAAIGDLGISDRQATRLDLARWLVCRENPLTARVFVNRLWRQFMGHGLVRSMEDFGNQGEWPTHPELLDWLAVDFMEHGWDVKRLVHQIVTSQTYRQSSQVSAEQFDRDPFNRLFARQTQFRFSAETIRDNALAVSGLLVEDVGGPSVKPYQPDGYWQHLNFPAREWHADQGPNQYRRGMYTFWCRSFLQPSLLAFDAPTREECTSERPRSNTPLQALVLLNDPTYVEAARVLARQVLEQTDDDTARLQWIWQRVLQRDPTRDELAVMQNLLDQERQRWKGKTQAAEQLQQVGQAPQVSEAAAIDNAVWTAVARTLLNLHETITRT